MQLFVQYVLSAGYKHYALPKTGPCTFVFNKHLLKGTMDYNLYVIRVAQVIWDGWKVGKWNPGWPPIPPSW